MLALTGKAVEGEVLTALEVIPSTHSQHNVWKKYKKEVSYQWSVYIYNLFNVLWPRYLTQLATYHPHLP